MSCFIFCIFIYVLVKENSWRLFAFLASPDVSFSLKTAEMLNFRELKPIEAVRKYT